MKKLFAVLLGAIVISLSLFAQDTTGTTNPPVSELPSWVYILGAAIVGIYEVLARLIPTLKNYSILGIIINMIQTLVPNKSTDSKTKLP